MQTKTTHNYERRLRWITIMRNSSFIIVFLGLGAISSTPGDDNPLHSTVIEGFALLLLIFIVLRMFVKIFAETNIWTDVMNQQGFKSIDDLHTDLSRLPTLGPVLMSGIKEHTVDFAYVDQTTNMIIQKIACMYGTGGFSSTSFKTEYIVMTIPLAQETPQIFIDGLKKNNFHASTELWALNKKLGRHTRAPYLEGDFRNFFRVYTPYQNQLDSFVVLTPDVMLELRDKGYELDYELYGNSLCVIRDANIKSSTDLTNFIATAKACAAELVPQIVGHTFTPAPALQLRPWRTVVWGYLYSLRRLGVIVLEMCILFMIGVILTEIINYTMR